MSGPAAGQDDGPGWQRLDKWLWCARFLRQRADCARLAGCGQLRINRQPTDKPHARVRVGDTLTVPRPDTVLVVQVLALAARRGPATEAAALYRRVEPVPASPPTPLGQHDETQSPGPPDDIHRNNLDGPGSYCKT